MFHTPRLHRTFLNLVYEPTLRVISALAYSKEGFFFIHLHASKLHFREPCVQLDKYHGSFLV